MLPNGVEVAVDTKDVELIFGFPNGGITIDRCDRNTGMKYLETVPLDEEADANAMQTKVLETKVLQETGGGALFKKIFLLLLETALIETSPCGYVRPRIVDILGDLQKVKKHNWCKYLLDNLLRTHELWKNNRSKVFSGPVVFLVSFYVDRVVHRRRCVARAIPRIKGWTAELLKEREEDEMKEADFGLGRVTLRLDENEMGCTEMTTEVQRPADEDVADAQETEDFIEPPPTNHGEPWSTEDVVEEIYTSDEVVYMRGVWGATKHIGDGLKMLAKELNKAPPEIRKRDSFRITCDTLRRAFRLDDKDFDPVESMTQSQTANYSAAEDWSESLKSLLDAADKMDILENKDDYPSFSLGFDTSQDDGARQPETDPQPEADSAARYEEGDASEYELREPADLFFSGDDMVSQEGDRDNTADFGGCGLDLVDAGDIGREFADKEPVASVQVGTFVNEENAIEVASANARDVASEHDAVDIAVCSAVEAVLELGDAAFETQVDTVGAEASILPVRRDAEMNRAQSTYAEIQPAPARRLRLPTRRREGADSKRISPTWTQEEMDCYQFLLATPYMWTDHVIYADEVVEVTKKKFSSLKPHEAVHAEVIDVWASYLNGVGVHKPTQKPRRLFVTTAATTYNVVERSSSWEKSDAELTFCDEIEGQFNGAGTFDITRYDLIFFPIYSQRHYYLVCFSLKTGVADVLDHVVPENGTPDRAKYGIDLDLLRDCLAFYLKSKGFNKLDELIIKERSIRLLELPWKTTQATNDSGVFLMRHMETYLGNPANLMTMGLQGVSVRLLQVLRGRYCKDMLLAPFNDCRHSFSSYISHYINVTPNFRTDYARQVNGMLNMAPLNEQSNQPARKKSKAT
ncbi:uncharacterized protein LOC121783670 [Salvia splendens]|uniref:uncharacterized protein LOC121783670 n=1 Tax=Salvia splendens TaxID=180675 RepID=UPI001C27384B|nr:uncharacterized protein LOC121783670 [Salvia splendens]